MPRCTLTGGRPGSAWSQSTGEPDRRSLWRLPRPLGVPLRTAQIGGHPAPRRRPVCVLDFAGLLPGLPHMPNRVCCAVAYYTLAKTLLLSLRGFRSAVRRWRWDNLI